MVRAAGKAVAVAARTGPAALRVAKEIGSAKAGVLGVVGVVVAVAGRQAHVRGAVGASTLGSLLTLHLGTRGKARLRAVRRGPAWSVLWLPRSMYRGGCGCKGRRMRAA